MQKRRVVLEEVAVRKLSAPDRPGTVEELKLVVLVAVSEPRDEADADEERGSERYEKARREATRRAADGLDGGPPRANGGEQRRRAPAYASGKPGVKRRRGPRARSVLRQRELSLAAAGVLLEPPEDTAFHPGRDVLAGGLQLERSGCALELRR